MTGSNTAWIDLPDEGVLAARGPDARKFLNGQLSQQLLSLGAGETALAGLHNPQGRTLALLRIVADGPQDLLCVLPRSLLEGVLLQLRTYLLRSQVVLTDETPLWRVQGRWPAPGAAAAEAPTPLHWQHTSDGRQMRLERRDTATESSTADLASKDTSLERGLERALGSAQAAWRADWQRADIAAGVPRIHPATQGEFVAQMLNLDVLGGISFNKGCYTGQEVIARAHFRGRVKRRLQRFAVAAISEASSVGAAASTAADTTLVPGARVTLADGRDAVVVDRAAAHEGQVEFLAVARYPVAVVSDAPEAASEPSSVRIDAVPLPLPYELPPAD
jgi:folate-binding protein YgfZ